MLINMQLSDLLLQAGLSLSLRWKPREQNTRTDDLTNEVFGAFAEKLRTPLSFSNFSDLPLRMLSELWDTICQFDAARATARSGPTRFQKRRRKEKTPCRLLPVGVMMSLTREGHLTFAATVERKTKSLQCILRERVYDWIMISHR